MKERHAGGGQTQPWKDGPAAAQTPLPLAGEAGRGPGSCATGKGLAGLKEGSLADEGGGYEGGPHAGSGCRI